MTRYLSIVVVIKNRTNFDVNLHNRTIKLKLFENNIDSLFKLIQPDEMWELIVIDFDSTDVDMKQFLKNKFQIANKPNFTFKLHTIIGEPFCKGKGLNISKTLVSYDNILYLDADMYLKRRDLINNGYDYVSKNKVYFPICVSYLDPEHTKGVFRASGTGNVFIGRNNLMLCNWNEYSRWGNEDSDFYDFFDNKNIAVRDNANETFFHQWHPTEIAFKNRYYSNSDNDNRNNSTLKVKDNKKSKYTKSNNQSKEGLKGSATLKQIIIPKTVNRLKTNIDTPVAITGHLKWNYTSSAVSNTTPQPQPQPHAQSVNNTVKSKKNPTTQKRRITKTDIKIIGESQAVPTVKPVKQIINPSPIKHNSSITLHNDFY